LIAWGENQPAFDPVASGQLDGSILFMTLAPDNDLVFVTSAALSSGICKLYRADYETGSVTCISTAWVTYPDQVRFDDAGNAYFWGTGMNAPDYGTYLKKSTPDGVTADVIDPAVVANIVKTVPSKPIGEAIVPFEVSPNGDVLIVVGGKVRRIKDDGTPEVVGPYEMLPDSTNFCGFKHGKLYLVSGNQMFTYTPGSSSLDTPPWIGPPGSGALHLTTEIATGWGPRCFSQEFPDGSLAGAVDGKFEVDGSDVTYNINASDYFSLVQYYPSLRILNYSGKTTFSRKQFGIQRVGSKLLINRVMDPDDQFAIDVYDRSSDSFTTLLPPTGDLKVLHMAYSPGDGLIYFDGIDYETFRNFLGTIDPETGERQYLDSLDGDLGQIFAFD